MIINIYKLINPSTNEVIYVGQTRFILEKRLKKPEGFAEHLSAIRKGKNNPMAKKLMYKVGCYKGFDLVKVFEYAYEIDNFIGTKGAWSNIKKVLNKKLDYLPYGYNWKYIKE